MAWELYSTILLLCVLSPLCVNACDDNCQNELIKKFETLLDSKIGPLKDELAAIKANQDKISNNIDTIKDKVESFEDRLSELTNIKTLQETTLNDEFNKRTLMMFNPVEIELYTGQEAHLECGVIGSYTSCQWEHDGQLYQVSDVINGSHSGFRAEYNSLSNQCGIIITGVNTAHSGIWSCQIISSDQIITASKTLTIEIFEIIFNQTAISRFVGEEAELNCGVNGLYQKCQWEHAGLIYQYDEVENESHLHLRADSNNTSNQCGIIITTYNTNITGTWTCNVYTIGQKWNVTTSLNLTVESNEIIFNQTEISAYDGEEVDLQCGVIGIYDSCQWEHNRLWQGGLIYQFADILNGSHSNVKAANKRIRNQCGIIISVVNITYQGVWTCTIHNYGDNLNDSKNLNVEKNELIFSRSDIQVYIGQSANLNCGIKGVFYACYWEHEGNIYQMVDIKNGSYNYIEAALSEVENECGIILHSVSTAQYGNWTCKASTAFGKTLTGSKEIKTACVDESHTCGYSGSQCRESCLPTEYEIGSCTSAGCKCCMEKECLRMGSNCEHGLGTCQASCPSTSRAIERSPEAQWAVATCNGADCSCCKIDERYVEKCTDNYGIFFIYDGEAYCAKERTMNWTAARDWCETIGWSMAQPKNPYGVASIMESKSLTCWFFIGGKGNNYNQIWLNGSSISNSNALWESSPNVQSDYCLVLDACAEYLNKPLGTKECTYPNGFGLCEL